MDEAVKLRHEEFVQGHSGGSFIEVVALTSLLQISHILYSSFLFACPFLIPTVNDSSRKRLFRWIFDFICLVLPFTCAITIASNYVYAILLAQISIIIINFWFYIRRNGIDIFGPLSDYNSFQNIAVHYPVTETGKPSNRIPLLTNLMSCLLLATSIAILAVDFPMFDRRFAKTENYGWSLMDVGVGAFIAINGSLSTEARLMDSLGSFDRIIKTIKSTIPLFVLGILRLTTVKSLNYQEHITEYGVHWNFFFTICFTKILSSILCGIFGVFNTARLGLWLTFAYQISLTYGGVSKFLNNQNRDDFFSANKEGFASLIGSVGLYLIFIQYGRKYLPKRTNLGEILRTFSQLIQTAGGASLFMYICHSLVEQTSRRETNLAFIFFMIAFITILIAIEFFYFGWRHYLKAANIYALTPPQTFINSTDDSIVDNNDAIPINLLTPIDQRFDSKIFQTLGPTGLAMFLVANLLTGSINFMIDTLNITSGSITLAILIVYTLILILFCRLLYYGYYASRIVQLAQRKAK